MTYEICQACDGEGVVDEEGILIDCPVCAGDGRMEYDDDDYCELDEDLLVDDELVEDEP